MLISEVLSSADFVRRGEVVSLTVSVSVDREPQGHPISTRCLEDFVCLFEDMSPAMVLGDEATQAIHHVGVETTVSLHSVV